MTPDTTRHEPTLRRLVRNALARGPALLAGLGLPGLALGGPTDGTVVAGSATITTPDPNGTVIDQTSQNAIINWGSFSIGAHEYVTFVQPSSSSVVLNRVIGGNPSEIFGALSATGHVYLVNPWGIVFGPSATVDVQGLVATTLDIADADFMSGHYVFTRAAGAPAQASVVNQGSLTAREGGYVVLAGDYVENTGLVMAQAGRIALAAGSAITLDMDGDGLVNFAVDEATLAELAGVRNAGSVIADGGTVLMTAEVASDLVATAVNNEGLVRAHAVEERDGAIYLVGRGGDVVNSGTLDTDGENADGGTIIVYSDRDVTLADGGIETAAGGANHAGGVIRAIAAGHLEYQENNLIRATGGLSGGFVEVSGHGSIALRGTPQIGAGGTFFIDPATITIVDGTGAPTGSTGAVADGYIESQLNLGVNVVLAATSTVSAATGTSINATSGAGDLTIGIGTMGPGTGGTCLGLNSSICQGPAPTFTATGGGTINLANLSLTMNGDLFISNTSGSITLGDATANSITISGAGGTVNFANLNATGGVLTATANQINGMTATAAGDLTLVASGSGALIKLSGTAPVSGLSVTLSASAPSYGGRIELGSGQAEVSFTGAPVTATGGDINITVSGFEGVFVAGALNATGNIGINIGGGGQGHIHLGDYVGGVLTTPGNVNAGGMVTLSANGNDARIDAGSVAALGGGIGITVNSSLTTSGGVINVGSLSGSAISLTATNTVSGGFAAITVNGDAVTTAGDFFAEANAPAFDQITFNGNVTAAGNVGFGPNLSGIGFGTGSHVVSAGNNLILPAGIQFLGNATQVDYVAGNDFTAINVAAFQARNITAGGTVSITAFGDAHTINDVTASHINLHFAGSDTSWFTTVNLGVLHATGTASGARDVVVAIDDGGSASAAAVTIGGAMADNGDVSLTAFAGGIGGDTGTLTVTGNVSAARFVNLYAPGAINAGALAGGHVSVTNADGSIAVGAITTSGGTSASAGNVIVANGGNGNVLIAGSITATGAVSVSGNGVVSNTGHVTIQGNVTGTDIAIAAAGGRIELGTGVPESSFTGGDLDATAGNVNLTLGGNTGLGGVIVAGDIMATGSVNVNANVVGGQGHIHLGDYVGGVLTTPGNVNAGGLVTLSASGSDARIDAGSVAGNSITLSAANNAGGVATIDVAVLTATGNVSITGSGGQGVKVLLDGIDAGGSVNVVGNLTGSTGSLVELDILGPILGTNVNLNANANLAATANVSVSVTGDVTATGTGSSDNIFINANGGSAGGATVNVTGSLTATDNFVHITANGANATATIGGIAARDAFVGANDGVTAGNVTVTRNLALAASAGTVNAGSLSAINTADRVSISVTAGTGITVGDITASGRSASTASSQSVDPFNAAAARVSLFTFNGDVTIGAIGITGLEGTFSGNFATESMSGTVSGARGHAELFVNASGGTININGDLTVTGDGRASAVLSGGDVTVGGNVSLTATPGSSTLTATANCAGCNGTISQTIDNGGFAVFDLPASGMATVAGTITVTGPGAAVRVIGDSVTVQAVSVTASGNTATQTQNGVFFTSGSSIAFSESITGGGLAEVSLVALGSNGLADVNGTITVTGAGAGRAEIMAPQIDMQGVTITVSAATVARSGTPFNPQDTFTGAVFTGDDDGQIADIDEGTLTIGFAEISLAGGFSTGTASQTGGSGLVAADTTTVTGDLIASGVGAAHVGILSGTIAVSGNITALTAAGTVVNGTGTESFTSGSLSGVTTSAVNGTLGQANVFLGGTGQVSVGGAIGATGAAQASVNVQGTDISLQNVTVTGQGVGTLSFSTDTQLSNGTSFQTAFNGPALPSGLLIAGTGTVTTGALSLSATGAAGLAVQGTTVTTGALTVDVTAANYTVLDTADVGPSAVSFIAGDAMVSVGDATGGATVSGPVSITAGVNAALGLAGTVSGDVSAIAGGDIANTISDNAAILIGVLPEASVSTLAPVSLNATNVALDAAEAIDLTGAILDVGTGTLTVTAGTDIVLSSVSIGAGTAIFTAGGSILNGGVVGQIDVNALFMAAMGDIVLPDTNFTIGTGTISGISGDDTLLQALASQELAPASTSPNAVFAAGGALALGNIAMTGSYLVLQGNALTLAGNITGPANLLTQILPADLGASISIEASGDGPGTVDYIDTSVFDHVSAGTIAVGGSGQTGDITIGTNGIVDLGNLSFVVFTQGHVSGLGNILSTGFVGDVAVILAGGFDVPIVEEIDPTTDTGSHAVSESEEEDEEDRLRNAATEEGEEEGDEGHLVSQRTGDESLVCK
ncbi:MAG TPA: filamentous hemagglutinin N-terminal domain-containing protein [Gammaproteobacteria bacterium]|nr:filamentous hemagglutinin N-terminal domain-containing protein [Gammaproteobacteria bacterium]